jgi:hypothetical protein
LAFRRLNFKLGEETVSVHLARLMKCLLRFVLLVSGLVAISGCYFQAPKEVFHAGDEVPPDFLTGPAALLLTNLDGFSASVAFSLPATAGQTKPVSGDLLERQGRLIFQPAQRVKKKNSPFQGGMIFIWDVDNHGGYVLSDALQAYARMTSGVRGTNVLWETAGANQEEVNGHPCRRLQAAVQCDDGSAARFIVWQAQDARYLPVRIQATTGSRQFTLDLYKVRLDLPKPELFIPPDGFTRYATAVVLMNELIIRQTALLKSYKGTPEEFEQLNPNVQNWRQGQAQ